MVSLIKHDLEFILKQIKIAEAHANGEDLRDLVAEAGGLDPNAATTPTQAFLLPYGLRTVDGTYNNLVEGRETWGAADQPFPVLTPPSYVNEGDDSLPFSQTVVMTNNDYGQIGGNVVDADPRIISNLVADQTLDNPAAISAALTYSGITGAAQMTAITEIVELHTILKAIPAPAEGAQPSAAYTLAKGFLDEKLEEYGIRMDGNTVLIPNVAPDIGDSAPYNSLFTLFGQFFDHGLDLIAKGGSGTVYIPLQPDDPLYKAGSHTNFMAMSRAAVPEGENMNVTTPWVDQNQTYTSHPSHQVFLREYTKGPDGKTVATGNLLDGARGLATWADVKAQAKEMLGIDLTDIDVTMVPLLRTDPYGNFIPDPVTGYAQVITGFGADNTPNTADDIVVSGTADAPVSLANAIRTAHAFLDDIAHSAVPGTLYDHDNNPATAMIAVSADTDTVASNQIGMDSRGNKIAYDNELLDAHYITGDGRGNENIGLTSIHHVFHSEHNHLVQQVKDLVLSSGDLAFLNEWLLVPVTAIPANDAGLQWNGERLFQAARFTNEMEYQHLVFEEFARKMQPDVDAFVFEPSVDINPAIFAEFAQAVYRFGHSMLNENIDTIDAGGTPFSMTLFDGFLNPLALGAVDGNGNVIVDHEMAAGAVFRGMSRQHGNEIDEFVTHVLRNQLVGIPLDLAALNIARGRDLGLPSLNEARAQFYQMAGQDSQLKPYVSWTDFALNLQNPLSIVNFIAAYGKHPLIEAATTLEGKRAAATLLIFGGTNAPADRLDFLNATGAWNPAGADGIVGTADDKETGLNDIDLWMGGLAEKKMDFGGMLGSTFSFVFEAQLEALQDADRFYYLSRVQGLNLLNELENNSMTDIIMRNTDLGDDGRSALPGDIFATPAHTLEMIFSKQVGADPIWDNPVLQALSPLVVRVDANNDGVAEELIYNGTDHVVMGGTSGNDKIVAGEGDDTVWGYEGNDTIEAGYGVDIIHGGKGDDIITNAGTDIGMTDKLHGEEGNDVIQGGSGLALLFGNQGQDFLIAGPDGKTVFGGTGNDFILGGDGGDGLMGNEGDDWIEGGPRFDIMTGDNSELFFNSTIVGHDVLNGGASDTDYDAESGDDIMFQAEGIQRNNGMAGFDWAIHKGDTVAANSDLGIPLFDNQEAFILRDRFDLVEGLSGWKHDDILTGRVAAVNTRAEATGTAAIPNPDSPLDSFSNDLLQKNVALIDGLGDLVAHRVRVPVVDAQGNPVLDANGNPELIVLDTSQAADIILGGGGSDTIKGFAGDDIIDGDKWLNVRILITVKDAQGNTTAVYTADGMTGKVYRDEDYENGAPKTVMVDGAAKVVDPAFGGKTLDALMLSATLNPGQLSIVREIVDGNKAGDIDVAVYGDVMANYAFTLNADGSVTVEHVTVTAETDPTTGNNRVSDGIDRLFNIERLRFADGEFAIDALVNRPPTGVPTISDMTPTEGQTLTASTAGVADPNGIGSPFTYRWQMSADGGTTWTNVAGATGASFTPSDGILGFGGQVGGILRVEVTFTDGQGNVETVVSAPTSVVGDNWDAVPILANTFNGTAGDDIADGTSGFIGLGANDTLNGNGGNDILSGAGGSDVLNGGAGDDRLDGGAGTDVAVYAGSVRTFTFGLNATGQLIVTDLVGAEGTDTLTTIEQLRFAGTNYTLINGTNSGTIHNGGTGADIILGHAGTDTLNGNNGNDVLVGGAGNDAVNGGAGNDTLLWRVGDGHDFMDGGTNTDTAHIGGDASAETFRIYSRTEALAAGITGLNTNTEIVITRNGTDNASIIAELDNIEEIVINGMGGGDTFIPIGTFAGTSLATSTITLDGTEGNDTVDITALTSAHRVVFRSNGGNDTIVGTLRAQDVIELAPGLTAADYTKTFNDNGTTTLASDGHSITYKSDGNPILQEREEEEDDEDHDDDNQGGTGKPVVTGEQFKISKGGILTLTAAQLLENDVDPDGGELSIVELDEDEHGTVAVNGDGTITFTPKDGFTGEASFTYTVADGQGGYSEGKVSIIVEKPVAITPSDPIPAAPAQPEAPANLVLRGNSRSETLRGDDGNDRVDGGRGHDKLYGGSGTDRLNGGDGNDRLDGGIGNDKLDGGRGHDKLYGGSGDDKLNGSSGNDRLEGGRGNDRLDGGSGHDKLYGGAGNDVLKGGAGDDRISGGVGEDTFVFQKGGGRDVVTDYRDGLDRIDASHLSGVDSISDLRVMQVNHDTVIEHGTDILVLKGVTVSDLDNSDFIF